MPTKARVLAFAQLLRLPNVFTAFADVGMAGAASGAIAGNTGPWVLVLLASGCLYLAGMVWNDVFDRAEDAKTQPFRPIPSGRVAVRTARVIGLMLLAVGIGLAWLAREQPLKGNFFADSLALAGALGASALLYDRWLKRTPVGPVGMGWCRFLNVLFGASVVGGGAVGPTPYVLHLAAVVGLYIVGVTWFARTEEAESNRRQLLAAAGVMLAAVALGLAVPVHLPPGTSPWYFPYLLVGFGFTVGLPLSEAVRRPDAKRVQAAVKRSILGLVLLDAVLATAFVGWPGLLILLLLPPALLLGKWVYST